MRLVLTIRRWLTIGMLCPGMLLGQGQSILSAQASRQSATRRSNPTVSSPVHPAVSGSVAALQAVLGRADAAMARSLVTPNQLRGELAEQMVNRSLVGQLRDTGNWQMIRPRLGAQGLDGVLVKIDSLGRPRQLLVAETKYNTARLGTTRDGVQMGRQWLGRRLAVLAGQYRQLSQDMTERGSVAGSVPHRLLPQEQLDIPMPGGELAKAWREPRAPWKLDITRSEQATALRQASRMATYLQGAAEGRVSYRFRIFRVIPVGDQVRVKVYDASGLNDGVTRLSQLPQTGELSVYLSDPEGFMSGSNSPDPIVRTLWRKLPHLSDADAISLASTVLAIGDQRTLTAHMAGNAARAGVVVAVLNPVLEVTGQWLTGRVRLDPKYLAAFAGMSMASTALGVVAGDATVVVATQNALLNQFARSSAGALGLPATSLLTNAVGGVVANGVASIAYVLFAYQVGWMDAQAARRSAIEGVAAGTAGVITWTGGLALIAAFGTSSTGMAISSLSGSAASSATLAWLGGGSVATGGGGVLLGSVIATGGVILVTVVVGAAVAYGFHYKDEKHETQRILLTIDDLKSRSDLSAGRFDRPVSQ